MRWWWYKWFDFVDTFTQNSGIHNGYRQGWQLPGGKRTFDTKTAKSPKLESRQSEEECDEWGWPTNPWSGRQDLENGDRCIWKNLWHLGGNIFQYHWYSVTSGVLVVSMSLNKHIPSHVVVAVYRALISYEGQPTTCHSYNEPGHLKTVCPHRRRVQVESRPTTTSSRAYVAARGTFKKSLQ